MFIGKSCEQGCARGALAVGLLAFPSSGGARRGGEERSPGCFAFGGVCAADENKRFAPGSVPFVLPKGQGREELLLKHLPDTALLCRYFFPPGFSRSSFCIPAQL